MVDSDTVLTVLAFWSVGSAFVWFCVTLRGEAWRLRDVAAVALGPLTLLWLVCVDAVAGAAGAVRRGW